MATAVNRQKHWLAGQCGQQYYWRLTVTLRGYRGVNPGVSRSNIGVIPINPGSPGSDEIWGVGRQPLFSVVLNRTEGPWASTQIVLDRTERTGIIATCCQDVNLGPEDEDTWPGGVSYNSLVEACS